MLLALGARHSSTGSDDEAGSSSASDGDTSWAEQKGQPRLTQEERKAHKKEVKLAARERRKTKVPKHVKKKATKSGKR